MANTPSTFEKKWPTVILAPIGVANHVVTVSDTAGLHTKAIISLSKAGQETVEFEIKRVLSDTELQVGFFGKPINALENPVQFDGGMLTMSEQKRTEFGADIVLRAVYEEEPAVALRNLLVSKYGAPIDVVTRTDGKTAIVVDTGQGGSTDLPYTDDVKIDYNLQNKPSVYHFLLGAVEKYFVTVTYNVLNKPIEYKTTVI